MIWQNSLKVAFIGFAVFVLNTAHAQEKRIEVVVDTGTELVNALMVQNSPEFLLDSAKDFHLFSITKSMRLSDAFFKAYQTHQAVLQTRLMSGKIGTGVYLLPLFYSGWPNPKRHSPISQPILEAISSNVDSAVIEVDQYMATVGKFMVDASFASFQKKYDYVYKQALQEVRQNLPNRHFIPTMERYYGVIKTGYRIIVNPFFKSEWGMSWQVVEANGLVAVQIAAPFNSQRTNADSILEVGYNNKAEVRSLSVHEFGHSFVNTLTLQPRFANELAKYKHLFKPVSGQAQYSDWETLFNEHLVRAGEIRLALALGLPEEAKRLRNEYKDWMYLSFFEKQLQEYEKQRRRYPNLESFLPKLLADLRTLR